MVASVDPKYSIHSDIEIPHEMLESWQRTIDLMAELVDVPAGLIMRVHPTEIEVLVASDNPGNVYEPQEKADLNTGLYCETVMDRQKPLLVPDALRDRDWAQNPDIDLGMISYFGVPLIWPDNKVFGTVCVLDTKPNPYNEQYKQLVIQFRDAVQLGLKALYDKQLLIEAQEQMVQSAKLASIGEMAASLAHELNQPLGVIGMTAELNLTRLKGQDSDTSRQLEKALSKIQSQVQRADIIISHLRDFSRKSAPDDLQIFSVAELISSTRILFNEKLHESGIQLLESLADDLPELRCNLIQMQQVLTNLISNAIHAVEEIPAEQSRRIEISASVRGGKICIDVSDNGQGIPKEAMGRLFDPFFTTKPPGAGTGLGLSISKGLIESHGGQISVRSEAGKGSCFTIAIPAHNPRSEGNSKN